MKNVKTRYNNKSFITLSVITSILVILIIILNIIVYKTDILEVKESTIITNNISFNNSNTTDMLKVPYLKKLSNDKGLSKKNKSYVNFKIAGEKDTKFQIVLYHIGNIIDNSYVKFELLSKNERIENSLDKVNETKDGGKIIYEGIIDKNNNYNIKMWVDKAYKEDIKNISYEVKIK